MKNLWNILSAIAGVLAVAVAVFVFYQDRVAQRKSLEVELVARSRLVSDTVTLSQRRIELLYNGQKIPNYELLQVRTANRGRQPIRSEDYEVPLQLTVGKIERILSAEQTGGDPRGLTVAVAVANKTVTVPGILLNPTDWFALEIGVVPTGNAPASITVDGRIAGIKRVLLKEASSPQDETARASRLSKLTVLQGVLVLVMLAIQQYMMHRRFRS